MIKKIVRKSFRNAVLYTLIVCWKKAFLSFHYFFCQCLEEKSTFKFSQKFSLRDLLDQQYTNYFKKIHGFVGKLSLKQIDPDLIEFIIFGICQFYLHDFYYVTEIFKTLLKTRMFHFLFCLPLFRALSSLQIFTKIWINKPII